MSAASKGRPKSEHMKKALSVATTGKPKPWVKGEKNPNYNGAFTSLPEVKEKFLAAVKLRGQPWTEAHKKMHSEKMKGASNAMRGKKHTKETKEKLSAVISLQYKNGMRKFSSNKISKMERDIAHHLKNDGYEITTQYHIDGIPYWYDFYFPKYNLILEFNGDYWHANPRIYKSGTFINLNGVTKLVDDIWKRDSDKKEAAIMAGYNILYVWASEYKKFGYDYIRNIIK